LVGRERTRAPAKSSSKVLNPALPVGEGACRMRALWRLAISHTPDFTSSRPGRLNFDLHAQMPPRYPRLQASGLGTRDWPFRIPRTSRPGRLNFDLPCANASKIPQTSGLGSFSFGLRRAELPEVLVGGRQIASRRSSAIRQWLRPLQNGQTPGRTQDACAPRPAEHENQPSVRFTACVNGGLSSAYKT
jgi:hypothetical protein